MSIQTKLLLELQEIDIELDRFIEENEFIPDKIEQQKSLINETLSASESAKNDLKKLQLDHKKLEGDLKAKEDEIKKHRVELNAIKTNEQYSALLTEIDSCQAEQDKIENEIIVVLEKIDKSGIDVKKSETDIKKVEAGINAVIKELEEKKVALEKEIAALRAKREESAGKVSKNILKKYERIRENSDGIGIASIVNGACGSCHIKLIHQIINEATKVANTPDSNELVLCDNCSRILYVEASLKPPAVTAVSEEKSEIEEPVEQASNGQ